MTRSEAETVGKYTFHVDDVGDLCLEREYDDQWCSWWLPPDIIAAVRAHLDRALALPVADASERDRALVREAYAYGWPPAAPEDHASAMAARESVLARTRGYAASLIAAPAAPSRDAPLYPASTHAATTDEDEEGYSDHAQHHRHLRTEAERLARVGPPPPLYPASTLVAVAEAVRDAAAEGVWSAETALGHERGIGPVSIPTIIARVLAERGRR